MTNKGSDGQLKPLSHSCQSGSGTGSNPAAIQQRFDTAAIFNSASTAVPIPVFHAVESAVAFTAVRQRFDKV